MPTKQSDLTSALQACADEPIHIPGVIQSAGVVLGYTQDGMVIEYASANTSALLDHDYADLLGTSLEAIFNRDQIHELRNAMARALGGHERVDIGTVILNDKELSWAVCPSEDRFVLEFEPTSVQHGPARASLADFPQIVSRLNALTTTQDFIEHLVAILAGLSQYDRVMAYRFDAEWNGEVIAESVRSDWDSYLGLRFPHWDIPAQAREMMKIFPLRFIADTTSPQINLHAAHVDLPPFNLSFAELRGVSEIHLKYLENMNAQATMTMTVMVGDTQWGVISFHNRTPRLPSTKLRQLLTALAPYVSSKLMALLHTETLAFHDDIDRIRDQIETGVRADKTIQSEAGIVVDAIRDRFDVATVAVGEGDTVIKISGDVSLDIIHAVRKKARGAEDGIWHSDHLARDLPDVVAPGEQMCGALCLDRDNGSWICLLRRATNAEVHWAGATEKQIVKVDGTARLEPRGSFSVYKELVKDRSRPWQRHDIRLLQGISASIIAANQRESLVAAMRRQQELVVDELNHRVRNIIALVRSISRQAASSSTTIDGYSEAMDQRINALATAHDLGASEPRKTVALSKVIRLEAMPYAEGRPDVVTVVGQDIGLASEAAPIMALVIHELMTNAAKYGALSVQDGSIAVALSKTASGARITWVEQGGPRVVAPNRTGFGTMLIEKAIPFELGGESEIVFNPTGVSASIFVPSHMLADLEEETQPPSTAPMSVEEDHSHLPAAGTILVVEDNFMLALDMASTLSEIGYRDVELASSLPDARNILAENKVICAILDINLGRGGSSIELAHELDRDGIPFFFVTGYGEMAPLPEDLNIHLKLQKPLSKINLAAALRTFLQTELDAP
ncbi:HWE histidine kinase domain-containing protein [Gymnodinialimonas sp. 2305UL16-5]|uniref:HWE histidine kinase domain-containing protein n=1 Tax=Gymnodinialimonas mytili TaxID=3126503 RepID=UPI0030A0654E